MVEGPPASLYAFIILYINCIDRVFVMRACHSEFRRVQAAGILKPKLHACLPRLHHVFTHSHVDTFLIYLGDLVADKRLHVAMFGNVKKINAICVIKSHKMSQKRRFEGIAGYFDFRDIFVCSWKTVYSNLTVSLTFEVNLGA